MSTMEEAVDTGQPVHWTVVHNAQCGDDQVEVVNDQAPLLVAMQPGVDVPAVEIGEVVVVTEGTEVVESQGGGTDGGNANYMQVATVEEVVEAAPYGRGNVIELGAFQEGDIARCVAAAESRVKAARPKGRVAVAKAPPPSSSSESESEDSSDQSDNGSGLRKKPKKREFAHRLQWRDRDMLEALKAVQEMKMTIRGAAKKFAVPYSTLKDRVHGRVRHGTKPGVKTALSPEEEEELVRYVKDMETAGFQLRYIDVRDRAGELLRLNHGHNSPYRDCSPGHNWLAGFLKRHPGLEFKRPSNRNCLPSMTKQKQMLRKFFDVAGQVFKKYKLHHKSDRIFCVSEIKLNCFQSATILVAMAADGTVLPPFVVFPGVRLKLTSVREAFPGAAFTSSYDGQINEDVFLWWFRDHFLKHVPSVGRKPSVLFLSRWVVDVTLQLAQKAKEEKVHLVCIPPGVAHLLLPLEDSIVHNLEAMVSKKASKWESENPGTAFTHRAFAQILHKVWRRAITSEHVTLKFAKNGLFPLNNLAISNERIFAAAQTMREIPRPPSPLHHGSPLSGLSLLSALSSHEYASLEHNNQVNLNDNSCENTPEQPRHKSYLEEQLVAPPTPPGAINTPLVTRKRHLHEMLERSLLQQQLEGGATGQQQQQPEETEDKEELAYKEVHSALVAARDNPDQINRAIDSILSGDTVMTSPSRKKLRTISDSNVKPSWKIVRIETVSGEGNASVPEQFSAQAAPPPEVVIHEEVIFDQIVHEETVEEETVVEEVVQEEIVQDEIVQEQIVQEQIVHEETVHEETVEEESFEQHPKHVIVNQDGSVQVCKPAVIGKPTTPTAGNWMSQFKEFIKIVPSAGTNVPVSGNVKSKFLIKGGEVFLQPVEMAPHAGSDVTGGHVIVKGEVMEMVGEEQVVASTGVTAVDLAASGDAKQFPSELAMIHMLPNGEQILVSQSGGESVVRQMNSIVTDNEQPVEVYTEDVVQETVVSSANDLVVASQQGGGGEPQTVVEECVVEYIQMLPEDGVWEEEVV